MIRPVQMDAPPTRPWHVKETSIYGANDQLVATVGVFTSHEDSALIAASPDLLEALRQILDNLHPTQRPGEFIRILHGDGLAAVARALAKGR